MYKTVFKASFRYLTSLISEQTLWWSRLYRSDNDFAFAQWQAREVAIVKKRKKLIKNLALTINLNYGAANSTK